MRSPPASGIRTANGERLDVAELVGDIDDRPDRIEHGVIHRVGRFMSPEQAPVLKVEGRQLISCDRHKSVRSERTEPLAKAAFAKARPLHPGRGSHPAVPDRL